MKRIFTNPYLRKMMLINMLFGMSEALFALNTVYLSSNGLSPSQIGIVFAIFNIAGTFSPVFGSTIADRFSSRYRVFTGAVIGYAVVIALLPISGHIRIGSTIVAMLLVPSLQLFHPTGSVMIATCSINAIYSPEGKGLNYSMFRVWMSLGYTLANFAFTPIINTFGLHAPYYIALAFVSVILILRNAIRKYETLSDPSYPAKQCPKPSIHAIFRNYYILTFLGLSIIYTAANSCSSYLVYILSDNAIETSQISFVSAVKVIGEIVILLMLPLIMKHISLSGLQLIAGTLLCLELLLIQSAKSLLHIAFIEMIGGLANGITFCTAGLYIRTMAPKGLESTAQSLFSMGSSLGGVILSAIFGTIVESHGILITYRCAFILEIVWVLLFCFFLYVGHRILKKHTEIPFMFNRTNTI